MPQSTRLSVVLPLLLVGCGEPAPGDGVDESDGGDEPVPVLDVQAVVYGTSSRTEARGDVWIHRRGEDAPTLIQSRGGVSPGTVCVHPDGTGYIRWLELDGHEVVGQALQAFEVGPDSVTLSAAPPWPPKLHPTGCPVGWGPAGYFVNLRAEDEEPDAPGLPYRVGPDRRAERVEDAQAAWTRLGRYALEAHGPADTPQIFEAVVWDLSQTDPVPIATWAFPEGFVVRQEGRSILLRRPWGVASFVPLDDPSRPPVPLVETNDVELSLSDSGEYATLTQWRGRDAWIEILHFVDGRVERSSGVTIPGAAGNAGWISDAGVAMGIGQQGEVLFALTGDGDLREVERVQPDSDYTSVGGSHNAAADAFIIGHLGGEEDEWFVRPSSGGEDVPIPISEDCFRQALIDSFLYVRCGDYDSVIDYRNAAEPISLEWLRPSPDVGVLGAVRDVWSGEPWHRIVYHGYTDKYQPVLLNPETLETVSLFHTGYDIGDPTYLPLSIDG